MNYRKNHGAQHAAARTVGKFKPTKIVAAVAVIALSLFGSVLAAAPAFADPGVTLTSITPAHGKSAGGTNVEIDGAGFSSDSRVDIGGVSVTPTQVYDDVITFVTPAHSAGNVEVSVVSPTVGASDNSLPYTYDSVPTIDSITPNSGTTVGNNHVVITGTGFVGGNSPTNGTNVFFGNDPAASVTVVSSTELDVYAPTEPAGTYPVTITSPSGTSVPDGNSTFTYTAAATAPAPTVTSLSSNSGSTYGGDTVTLTGTGFTGTTAVNFGETPAASFTVISDAQIKAVTPADSGSAAVTVTTPNGTSTPNSNATYEFVPTTSISKITPNHGAEAGGTVVTLTGTNFTELVEVDFNKVSVPFTVVSDTEITLTTPAGTGVTAIRTYDQEGGEYDATQTFTYDSPVVAKTPTITSLSATTGSTKGGNKIVIHGTDFANATNVQFGTTDVTSFIVVSDTEIDVVVPAGTGSVAVTVITPDGNAATDAGAYTYVAPADSGTGSGGATGTGTGSGTGAGSTSGNGSGGTTGAAGTSSAGAASTNPNKTLAFTGTEDAGIVALLGLGLMMGGFILIRSRRRFR